MFKLLANRVNESELCACSRSVQKFVCRRWSTAGHDAVLFNAAPMYIYSCNLSQDTACSYRDVPSVYGVITGGQPVAILQCILHSLARIASRTPCIIVWMIDAVERRHGRRSTCSLNADAASYAASIQWRRIWTRCRRRLHHQRRCSCEEEEDANRS